MPPPIIMPYDPQIQAVCPALVAISREAVVRHLGSAAADKDFKLAACTTLGIYLTVNWFIYQGLGRFHLIFVTVEDWAERNLEGGAEVNRVQWWLTNACDEILLERLPESILRTMADDAEVDGDEDDSQRVNPKVLADIVSHFERTLKGAGAALDAQPPSASVTQPQPTFCTRS
ncbi:MAG: hypothetical protein JWO94_3475 [Verrucomicrobiaceae bacterium]|nr:hypothetical protein [Verrucomicrobiaceae bacterium]